MDILSFLNLSSARAVALFVLKREVTVKAYVWICGSDPMTDPIEVTLPAGTVLRKGGYSNFGDGYSMVPNSTKVLGKMKQRNNRWFRVDYADMEYLHHIIETDNGTPTIVVKVQ